MSLGMWANIAQIAGTLLPVGIGMWKMWRNIDLRLMDNRTEMKLIAQNLEIMQRQLDVQFGGNGGGIREAINTMKDGQRVMDGKLDKACSDIANLEGKFNQHLQEA